MFEGLGVGGRNLFPLFPLTMIWSSILISKGGAADSYEVLLKGKTASDQPFPRGLFEEAQ